MLEVVPSSLPSVPRERLSGAGAGAGAVALGFSFLTCGIKIPILTLSALHDCCEDYIRPDWKVPRVH